MQEILFEETEANKLNSPYSCKQRRRLKLKWAAHKTKLLIKPLNGKSKNKGRKSIAFGFYCFQLRGKLRALACKSWFSY